MSTWLVNDPFEKEDSFRKERALLLKTVPNKRGISEGALINDSCPTPYEGSCKRAHKNPTLLSNEIDKLVPNLSDKFIQTYSNF